MYLWYALWVCYSEEVIASLVLEVRIQILRVWAISDETPGSATKGVYLCTRLQEFPGDFTCFREYIGSPPLLVEDPGVSSLMAHTLIVSPSY